jgi:hypothetical protein
MFRAKDRDRSVAGGHTCQPLRSSSDRGDSRISERKGAWRGALVATALTLFTTTYSLAQFNINPTSIGRTNTGANPDSPFCYVDGIVGTGHTPNIAACIAYLNALGVPGAGNSWN